MHRLAVFFSLLLGGASALYSSSSEVVDLTPANFQRDVVNSDEVWVVEFYAPWCGHCQRLVPEYQKAAQALKGVVKVGGVNADDHKSLAQQFGINGFPTIKIFGLDKKKPQDYNGQRTAKAIVDFALNVAKEKVNAQLSGKKSGGGGGGSGSGSSGSGSSDVIELTDSNFEKLVLKSDDMWLVEFFAPWCGHCKNLAPQWEIAASDLKGKVKLGALDATVHSVMASRYGVQGYPTIKFFHKGDVEDYDGGRTASDIVAWATDKAAVNIPPPEVKQLISNAVLDETCKEHPICVVAILPHILDCQSKCRNNYIQMLTRLGDKYKQKMWGWGWAEAMAQSDLEQALDIGGFGYPALAALNAKKMQFALLKGSFSEDGINEFLRDISYGRGRTAPVRGAQLPKLVEMEAWDGKDGALPEEEDIDLSDVELDDFDTKTEL
ncbi:protein disulfide-isomerase A6 homolog [Portunus trituberculatus]|uniref:protein disulfide-isomerase A6 homolog n=1 Tax=Portunus trituberculatus TaxID=210409 RepID=UPI001E1D204F|nr:protein disulfide-isomerase A6 homolog [Portunus trituberculatus]